MSDYAKVFSALDTEDRVSGMRRIRTDERPVVEYSPW
jgi:hypothetical protein